MAPTLGVLLVSLLIILFTSHQEEFEPTLDYEVQMADELYYTNPDIQEWVDSVRAKAGTYQREIDQFTYLLICAGDRGKEGYALALVDTIQSKQKLQVVYSLIKTNEEEVNTGQTAPFMLVRIPSSSRLKLVGKQIKESEIPDYLNRAQATEETNETVE